jgi:uncharacterized protein (TIGR00255 family)
MRSMTGFGRSEGTVGSQRYTMEIKSVNHRYLDLRFRLPAGFSAFEPPLTELLKARFERGSIDVVLRQAPLAGGTIAGTKLQADEVAAQTFTEACQTLSRKLKVTLTPTVEAMVLTGRIFLPVEESQDDSAQWEALKALATAACEGAARMRHDEGVKLAGVLRAGVREVAELADQCSRIASDHPRLVREKLQARIAQWGMGTSADPQRLEWEIAYFAERADITEEIDRLKSHAQAFEGHLSEKGSVGRKLDFLTQEMHREVNTMGSKAASLELTRLTVEGKQRIEKLREQAQNVE